MADMTRDEIIDALVLERDNWLRVATVDPPSWSLRERALAKFDVLENLLTRVASCEAWRGGNDEITLNETTGFQRCGRAPDAVTNGRLFRLCGECARHLGYPGPTLPRGATWT